MEDDIDLFDFAEKMSKYEENLPGVEFSLEQKEGLNIGEELWILDIFDEKLYFKDLDEALLHLDGIVKERNLRG